MKQKTIDFSIKENQENLRVFLFRSRYKFKDLIRIKDTLI